MSVKGGTGAVFHSALAFCKVGIDLEDCRLLQQIAETVIGYFDLFGHQAGAG